MSRLAFNFKCYGASFKIKHIQLLHHYSTSAIKPKPTNSPTSFVNFLVRSLGFSEQKALSTSRKLTSYLTGHKYKVNTLTSFEKPISVITFLKTIGLPKSEIRDLVCCTPQILIVKVETLKPKISYLQQVGLSGSHLVKAISSNPALLHRALDSFIIPVILSLKKVVGSDQNVIEVLKRKASRIFSCSYIDHLRLNVALLEKYEVPRDRIIKHVMQHARTFMRKSEVFKDLLVKVEEKWGIPRSSRMFLYGIQLLDWQSEKTLESKCQVYRRFGWSDSDIKMIFRKNPYCLMLSEARVTKSLEYLMMELGYGPEYLAFRPCLLTYSLDKRLVPRHKILSILKEKGLLNKTFRFYTAVTFPENKFFLKFVLPFKEVHEEYTKCSGHNVNQLTKGKPATNY